MEIPSSKYAQMPKPVRRGGAYASRTGNSHGGSKSKMDRTENQRKADKERSTRGPKKCMKMDALSGRCVMVND